VTESAARLLEPSIRYALGVVLAVSPELLSRPTPCQEWDLRMLLRHACESLAALHEGTRAGRVGLAPAEEDADVAVDPARAFCIRAGALLDTWTGQRERPTVLDIAGCPLPGSLMASAAALEMAVHGWDISQACGRGEPIPPLLALDLLLTAHLLAPADDRHPMFAAPVTIAATASPSDRLAAFLGRAPGYPLLVVGRS
jgi:uncharacterized protein (TIGR03086 family)